MLVLCMICMMGCSGNSKEAMAVEEEKLQIGICFDSFVIERWQRDRDVFVSRAQELGAEVDVQNANGDAEKQIDQIRYFIDQKVDVIVVIPTDAVKLSSTIKEAKKAGIKVIAYDRMLTGSGADLYISFDNEQVGILMAEALADKLPEGANIIMMCGPQTDSNVAYVQKGFEETAKKHGLNIKDIMYVDGWKPELGYKYISSNYRYLNEVDAIMCGNDSLACQIVKYLSELRKAGDIQVVGQDAELEACQRIMEGTQLMTVYKGVDELASMAAEYAIALAKNENIDVQNTIFDGTYETPYIMLEPIAVDKCNMDEVIIDGGFHLKEDVYLNVR